MPEALPPRERRLRSQLFGSLRPRHLVCRAREVVAGVPAVRRVLLLARCRACRGQPLALRRAWRGFALACRRAKGGQDRFRACPMLRILLQVGRSWFRARG